MLGAAAESMILEVRDASVARLSETSAPIPKGLQDWRVKVILDSLSETLMSKISQMPYDLRVEFEAYWPAFTVSGL